jgi:hypothetical protein
MNNRPTVSGASPTMSSARPPTHLETDCSRGVEPTALPTEEACRLIASLDGDEVQAAFHVTC